MLINNNQKFKFFPLLLFLVTAIILLFTTTSTRAPHPASAQTSPDAIAVRVIPNPEHYSAARWYREQGFSGSPQSLTVDGYEAIRDGRTVYVNAANINDNGTPAPTDDALYTNIYLISYNQKAEKPTVDIFAQILSHWQFNTNITQPDVCSQTSATACLKDIDCPLGEYCLSQKAKIIRDTKRLADLAEIKTALKIFRDKYHRYPILKSGSYLPYKTISVWPSWQKTLAQELSFVPLPVDPVNKLGACGEDRFNPITCWDEKNKEFADANPGNTTFDLPAGSKVYVYTVSPTGDNFNACGIMETTYTTVTETGDCNTMGANIQVFGSIPNQPPRFTYFDLRGFSGREYKGDIKAVDPDGDTLTWAITNITPANQWTSWHNSQPPILQNISPTEKLLYSPAAGAEGTYQIEITLDDNRGQSNSQVSQTFTVNILNPPPDIIAPDLTYVPSQTNPLVYTITARDEENSYPLTYQIISSPPFPAGLTINPLAPNLNFNSTDKNYNLTISGVISPSFFTGANSFTLNQTVTQTYTIQVTDKFGASSQATFDFIFINHSPLINNISNRTVTVGYNDLTTNPIIIKAIDPDDHDFQSFSLTQALPSGLTFNQINNSTYQITGIPTPITPINTEYSNSVVVTDDYNAQTEQPFVITITNQKPVIDPIACPNPTRWQNSYSCTVTAHDPDGHAITVFSLSPGSYPNGLAINNSGQISGIPTEFGTFQLRITATDQYGAESAPAFFDLTVNTYCGDGVYQTPNAERRGGPSDDGVEDCDGTDNVATAPEFSGPDRQYACTSGCDSANPNCTGTCQYTGGWCGDGILQAVYGEECEIGIFSIKEECDILSSNGLLDEDGSILDCDDLDNNIRTPENIDQVYNDVCNNCHIECMSDPNFDKLGVGCYLDTDGIPGVTEKDCQKGKYICQANNLVCYDVFSDPAYPEDYAKNNGNPIYDQCCLYLSGEASGYDFSGVTVVYPGTDYTCLYDGCDGYSELGNNNLSYIQGWSSGYFNELTYAGQSDGGCGGSCTYPYYAYNCDEICKKRGGKVCVGVGLGVNSSSCVRIRCDSGVNCNQSGNLSDTACKNDFYIWRGWSCHDFAGGHTFPVMSTACYCF